MVKKTTKQSQPSAQVWGSCKRCGARFVAGYTMDGETFITGERCDYCSVMPWAARSGPNRPQPMAGNTYERAQAAADWEEELDHLLNDERWTTPD